MAKSKNSVTVKEIGEKLPEDISTQRIVHALSIFCDYGYCTKKYIDRVAHYSLTRDAKYYISTNDLVQKVKLPYVTKYRLDEYTYKVILETLIKNSGSMAIMDLPFDTRKSYEQLMIIELQGFATRTEGVDNYIWKYKDRTADLRKEKTQLENKLKEYRNTHEEEISKCRGFLKDLNNLKFDKTKYELEIQKLEDSKNKLSVELASLGFFSFKQKKHLNNEIENCITKINDITNQMDNDEKSFINHNRELKDSYELTLENHIYAISSMEKKLQEIEEKLNKISPPYLDIVLERIENKKKRKHLSEEDVSKLRLENKKYGEDIIKIFESVQKPLTLDEIFDYMGNPPISTNRLIHILTQLTFKEKKTKINIENNKKYYSLNQIN